MSSINFQSPSRRLYKAVIDVAAIKSALVQKKIITIHGMPGVGKTSLAKHLGNTLQLQYTVLSIDCSSQETINASINKIGQMMSIKTADHASIITEMITKITNSSKQFLFILEDVASFKSIEALVANMPPQVHVLITTTDAKFNETYTKFEIPLMNKSTAIDLLKSELKGCLSEGHEKVIDALSEGTEHVLPFDISDAVEFLKRNNQISDFLSKRDANKWVSGLSNAFKNQPEAWKGLLMLAFLDGKVVSLKLLEKLMHGNFKVIKRGLLAFSLVTLEKDSDFLGVSELVQAKLRRFLSGEQPEMLREITDALIDGFKSVMVAKESDKVAERRLKEDALHHANCFVKFEEIIGDKDKLNELLEVIEQCQKELDEEINEIGDRAFEILAQKNEYFDVICDKEEIETKVDTVIEDKKEKEGICVIL